MSTVSFPDTVEGWRAHYEYAREQFLRIHEQDCREKRALEKRAKRAEAMLAERGEVWAELGRLGEQVRDVLAAELKRRKETGT